MNPCVDNGSVENRWRQKQDYFWSQSLFIAAHYYI